MLALLCLFASSALAATLLHEQEVSMNATSLTAGVFETFKLSTPVTLVANRRYGVSFEFDYSKGSNDRTYLGTRDVVTTQCGLFIPLSNVSWAFPAAYVSFGNYDFYLNTDLGENMATAQATSGAGFSPTTDDGGFGQTFDSGAGGVLNNITLFLARDMGINNALEATMRVYDLEDEPVSEGQNVQFLVRSSAAPTTSAPTGSPTTSSPTAAPTTSAPTGAPTTSSPTTVAPTGAPNTDAPTLVPTTSAPSSAAPTLMPSAAPTLVPTEDTVSGSPQVAAGALATVTITLLFL